MALKIKIVLFDTEKNNSIELKTSQEQLVEVTNKANIDALKHLLNKGIEELKVENSELKFF